MQVDPDSLFVLVLGPVGVGILLAALIWYIQRRWPKNGTGPRNPP